MMGRPRKLSDDDAIARALDVFWRKGYDRTSIADLSEALGVGPSSLYNAFGSKERLFRRAIERYVQRYHGFIDEAIEADLDVEPAARRLLREACGAYVSEDGPLGCAVLQNSSVGAASGGGPGAAVVADSSTGPGKPTEAAAITLEVKAQLTERFEAMLERAAEIHGTPLAASPRTLAQYLVATLRGLSQLAIDGASREELLRVGDVAARACVATD